MKETTKHILYFVAFIIAYAIALFLLMGAMMK